MGDFDRTEKITINLGLVDLGRIDLLVQEGHFTTRTEFIRHAVRHQLERSEPTIEATVRRRTLVLGARHVTRRELEGLRGAGEQLDLRVLGLATVAEDVDPDLARATIASVEVLGAFRAPRAVRAALADRIT